MASPLKLARDAIATAWEAATPPTTTNRPYHKLEGRTHLDGVSGDRSFWFDPPGAGVTQDFAESMFTMRHAFSASVRISSAGSGIDAMFDRVADEAVLLMGTLNTLPSRPAGVDYLQADRYQVVEIEESDDLLIVISITADTQETDGV